MSSKVENVNVDVLRKCREQMALDITYVKKKVNSIEAIEAGEKHPTFKQLETLAQLYKVPRWVFISDELPPKYDFAKSVPAFRQFIDQEPIGFSDWKIRRLVAQVERFRSLVIEIQEDLEEPLTSFELPKLQSNISTNQYAKIIREWLGVDGNLPFPKWKEKLEQKGIFVFMTSKYSSWSKIDNLFRGLSINYSTLPIIIINNSDAKKAQSFTLLHELGHLIKKENAIDSWSEQNREVEKWCDQLAGKILMPEKQFREEVLHSKIENIEDVKKLSEKFQASSYACLVRLQILNIISQEKYSKFEEDLKQEHEKIQESFKEQSGGPRRNRSKEAFEQYGQIYTKALFQAYHNGEIGLHKLCKSFDLKLASQVMELLEKRL